MMTTIKQKSWKYIYDANSNSEDELNAIALIDLNKKYTYREMFNEWEKYASVFSALGNNHWRIKYANKDYQIYKAIILILINALIFLLTGPKRSYFYFIVPIILWGMLIVIEGIDRFFKS